MSRWDEVKTVGRVGKTACCNAEWAYYTADYLAVRGVAIVWRCSQCKKRETEGGAMVADEHTEEE